MKFRAEEISEIIAVVDGKIDDEIVDKLVCEYENALWREYKDKIVRAEIRDYYQD